jgi:hypothetical protein
MYFRFGSALVLLILVCVVGIAIEKRCLELRRAVSRQYYRRDALSDQFARLRLETQQLGAPGRLFENLETGSTALTDSERPMHHSNPREPRLASKRLDREER